SGSKAWANAKTLATSVRPNSLATRTRHRKWRVLIALGVGQHLIAKQRGCELTGDKGLEIIHALAYTYPINRYRSYALAARSHRRQHATLGGTVQLGHHQTSQLDGGIECTYLCQRILASVTVHYQQYFVRRLGVSLGDHAPHLFK